MTSENWPVPGLLARLRELEAEEHQLKVYADQAALNLKQKSQQVADVRGNIKALLAEAGVVTEQTDIATVSVTRTRGKLLVEQPELIPDAYFTMQPVRDDVAIREALFAGQEVPGAKIVRSETIRVIWKD